MKDNLKSSQLLENDILILKAIRCTGGATRSELVVRCDLPQTTVYDALVRLERKGFVERYTEPRTLPGRPKIFYLLTVSAIRLILQQQEGHSIFKLKLFQDECSPIQQYSRDLTTNCI